MRLFFLSITFVFCQFAYSEDINIEKAKCVVKAFFGYKDNISVAEISNNYIVISKGENKGYVVVGRKNTGELKIIGYSEYGNWNLPNFPHYLKQWVHSINNYTPKSGADEKRNNYTRASNNRISVPILLNSRWHQNSPYNDMSPMVIDGNIKSLAGCVAIAASQIVNYWKLDNPSMTSYDTPTYPYGKAPVIYSVPAGTKFRWNLINDEYIGDETEEEKNAVATLVYIVGTSSWLQYSATGTGGHINDVIKSFASQFLLSAKYYIKNKYSQDDWEQLLYDNLLMSQPILYGGSSDIGGHAVVIDGYDAKLNLFHFNFGWGGNGDGYYTVDDITGMNGYSNSQSCVCDIFPMERNISIVDNSPNSLYRKTKADYSLTIENNSTLDLRELHYFLCDIVEDESFQLDKKNALFSSFSEISNNGEKYNVSVSVCADVNAGEYNLILTDENLRILKKKKVTVVDDTAINDMTTNERGKLILHKEGETCLVLETEESINVDIFTIDGKEVLSDYVFGKRVCLLPRGIYIINKKMWLQ